MVMTSRSLASHPGDTPIGGVFGTRVIPAAGTRERCKRSANAAKSRTRCSRRPTCCGRSRRSARGCWRPLPDDLDVAVMDGPPRLRAISNYTVRLHQRRHPRGHRDSRGSRSATRRACSPTHRRQAFRAAGRRQPPHRRIGVVRGRRPAEDVGLPRPSRPYQDRADCRLVFDVAVQMCPSMRPHPAPRRQRAIQAAGDTRRAPIDRSESRAIAAALCATRLRHPR
jgi:hypothetical protein